MFAYDKSHEMKIEIKRQQRAGENIKEELRQWIIELTYV